MTAEHNADSTLIDLKTARENSGLTLKELFERTRISVVNLEAIENGDFHLLPVPIYTRNFIKTYADALGVDSKPVLQHYENYLQTMQTKEKEQTIEQPPPAPLVVILSRYKAYLWVLCIIVVFAAVSFFVSLHNKPTPESTQKTEAQKEAVVAETKTQNTAQPDNFPIAVNLQKPEDLIVANQASGEKKQPAQKTAAAQTQSATVTPAATPKNNKPKIEALIDDEKTSALVVYATEETWIRIQADDKEPFQVLLKPGEKISHKAARFNMDIGNASGVRIQFDGKSLENLGKSGQVIHLRLP
jgi:cytoskeleton protein RodZ